MKKEYIYSLVIIVLMLGGTFFNMYVIENKLLDSEESISKYNLVVNELKRDSVINSKITPIKEKYSKNIRGNEDAVKVKAILIGKLENIFQKIGIRRTSETFRADQAEMHNKKDKLAIFVIDINFNTDFEKFYKLLSEFESDDLLIDIRAINFNKISVLDAEKDPKGIGKYTSKKINISMQVQITKFM